VLDRLHVHATFGTFVALFARHFGVHWAGVSGVCVGRDSLCTTAFASGECAEETQERKAREEHIFHKKGD